MHRLLAAAVSLVVAVALLGGCASTAAPSEDAGWSEPVNGLRARLSTRLSHVRNGTGVVVTHLELESLRSHTSPMLVIVHLADLTYRVTDADGRDLAPSAMRFSSPVADPVELLLPRDSSIRFRIGPLGFAVPADQAALVDLGPRFGRVLPRDGKAYFLAAVLDIAEAREMRDDKGRRWHGRLEIPRVRISTEAEAIDPAAVGPLIDRLGAEMLGADQDVSEEAVRRLSVIDDPRVVPWYLTAMRTDRYDLKLDALDRLSRMEGDPALEGLRVAMTTTGDDIGNCATAAVAASCADNVRHAAAHALARSPHPDARALLLSMEEDSALAVRLAVTQAAARMSTPESLALIERRTHDDDATLRTEAKRLLGVREKGAAR